MWFWIGLALVVAGAVLGVAGFAVGALVGVLLGAFAMVRAFAFGHGLERERGGPGQSGPGSPGYQGRVNVGDEGSTTENERGPDRAG